MGKTYGVDEEICLSPFRLGEGASLFPPVEFTDRPDGGLNF